ALVVESEFPQEAIGLQPVGLDLRAGGDVLPDEATERERCRVEHRGDADAADRFASPLDGSGDRRLVPGEAAPFMSVVVPSAEVGLVHLDAALERRAAELRQATAQLVQPGPGRLVLEPV